MSVPREVRLGPGESLFGGPGVEGGVMGQGHFNNLKKILALFCEKAKCVKGLF